SGHRIIRCLQAAHCCKTLTGVAAKLERFYKPELQAAHNLQLQADRPSLSAGAIIPLPGINDNSGIASHDLARQLQMPKNPEGWRQDLRLLQPGRRREKRSEGNLQASLFDEGAAGKPPAQ